MPFDPASKDDKAQLYRVLKAIAKLSYGDTVDLLIDSAVGQPVPHGDNWQRNYRRGEYDSVIAQTTHRWVEKHHFTLAHEVSPDIFPNTPTRQWRKILDERATSDGFNLVLVPSTFGVVQRDSQLEKVEQIIKLGQRFCFELDSHIDGYAIALQGRGDQWDVIGLGHEGEAVASVTVGRNRLPQLPNGQLDPISESSDEGITDFVMVVATNDQIPLETERLIPWVHNNGSNIYRRAVQLMR